MIQQFDPPEADDACATTMKKNASMPRLPTWGWFLSFDFADEIQDSRRWRMTDTSFCLVLFGANTGQLNGADDGTVCYAG